jgi:hypothetical protein
VEWVRGNFKRNGAGDRAAETPLGRTGPFDCAQGRLRPVPTRVVERSEIGMCLAYSCGGESTAAAPGRGTRLVVFSRADD